MALDSESVSGGVHRAPMVIFVLGGPGAGKGTQCERISAKYGIHHISAGDCLREERRREGSRFGELIESYIRDGKIVPVAITCELLLTKMRDLGWYNQVFMIDGFPRNQENLRGWYQATRCEAALTGQECVSVDPQHPCSCVETGFCLNFDCTEDVMQARLLKRGQSSGRVDDNIDSIKKRFQTFVNETTPIIELFKNEGKCHTINADQTVEAVWSDVQRVLAAQLA